MGVLYVSGHKPTVTVGRDPGCDLVLGGSYVSRQHLRFRRVTWDVALIEVMGTNGAVVDRLKAKCGYRGYVRIGDSVVIGSYRIVWLGDDPPDNGNFFPLCTNLPDPDMTPVEIEGPPPRRVPEKPSIMLAAGPALTMAIPILLGAGRSVAILSSVFAAVWAVVNVLGRVRKQKTEELRRRNTYLSYLSGCEDTIKASLKGIIRELNRTFPEAGGYLKDGGDPLILGRSRRTEEGHIRIRMGKGIIENPLEIIVPKERFEGIDDSLKLLPAKLKEKYSTIPSSPYLVTIEKGSLSVFVLKKQKDLEMLSAFILQIAVSFSPKEVKIQMKTGIDIARYYMWTALIPHFEQYPGEGYNGADGVVFITDDMADACKMSSSGAYSILVCKDTNDIPASSVNVLNRGHRSVRFDTVPEKLCFSYASYLAGIPEDDEDGKIPPTVPFGSLFETYLGEDNSFSEEKIRRVYGENDITAEFCAPIGMTSNNKITVLDIHEKAAGPHGLIAGTTGSGKSELLTTMILSFSLRYPPDKLAFFLIDYKGGGMSNMFADLPHLIGSISNLSKAVSKRAMVSLRSENIRRQKIFAQCGVNNINDYTRLYDEGKVTVPLPHVLIIIDEFAELKKEEPEFMDCLISVAQTGRSLGMHLILATQKPSGVVDDRIRSNSAFRIALRLLDRADSTDVLGFPDAAGICECALAYLLRGNDGSLEFFRSAYAMGPAHKTAHEMHIYKDFLCDEEVVFDEKYEDEDERNPCSWYELAITAIKKAADCCKSNPSKLWLPELPGLIRDERAYAWFDNPYEQTYEKAVYDPKTAGNILIIGKSGSGKSELIRTLLLKMTCERAVYIIDRPGGVLKDISEKPFCGGYVTCDDSVNMQRMLLFIDDMVAKRRRLRPEERKHLALSFLVVEDHGEIRKLPAPDTASTLERIIHTADGSGVILIATDTLFPDSRTAAFFDTVLFLGNHDVYCASSALKVPSADIPEVREIPGRGIGLSKGRALEFQTVLTDRKVRPPYTEGNPVPKYPYVPDKPSLENLLERYLPIRGGEQNTCLPVGFEYNSGKIYAIPLDRTGCVLICGKPYSGRHTLLFNVSVIAARLGMECIRADDHETLLAACEQTGGMLIVTIENIEAFLDGFYSDGYDRDCEEKLAALFENRMRYGTDEKNHPVIIGILNNRVVNKFTGRKIYESMIRHPYGLTLGGCLDENRILDYSYMSFSQMQKSLPRHNATVLKFDEKSFSGRVILAETINVDNS